MWVGDTEVDSSHTSGDGWSYDLSTHTLTLSGFNYSGDGYQGSGAICYEGEDNLTISISGENTVSNTNNSGSGILVPKAGLILTGTGSLNVSGAGNDGITVGVSQYDEFGLTIQSGTINANGADFGINCLSDYVSITGGSISSTGYEGLNIAGVGGLTVSGGSLKAIADDDGYGLQIYQGKVLITGGDVYAESTNCALFSENYTDAVVISGGSLTVVGENSQIGGQAIINALVKNAIAGTGWSDKAGTQGESPIAINTTDGYNPDEWTAFAYKRVVFGTPSDGSSQNTTGSEEDNNSQASETEESTQDTTSTDTTTGNTSTDTTTPAPAVVVTPSMSLGDTSLVLKKGKKASVSVTLENDSLTSATSSNTKVATASVSGNKVVVKAVKNGTANITVKSASGLTDTIKVKVQSQKATTKKIKLSKSSVTLAKKGKSAVVTATATPSKTSTGEKIKVSSSDKKIATAKINSSGEITIKAKKKGTCTITVKAGSATKTIKVKVKK